MNNSQLIGPVQDMVSKSDHIRYRGISIGQTLKVVFFSYLRTCVVYKDAPFKLSLYTIHWGASVVKRIVTGVLWSSARMAGLRRLRSYRGKGIVVVSDHPGHVDQMMLDLIGRFQKEDVILITTSPHIYSRQKNRFPVSLNLYEPIHYWRWQHLPDYYRYYRKLCRSVGEDRILFKLQFFAAVSSVIQAIDYYRTFFDTVNVSAVVTLSDRHWHEYVIAMAARKRDILTYTNQHGEFADLPLYTPFASDRAFVWGQKGREYLIQNGACSEQVVVSGNPKFDRVYSWYLPRKKEIKAHMQQEYGLKPDRLTVTLLSSGMMPIADVPQSRVFEIFKCFCQACELKVNTLVKLHPHKDKDDREVYRIWLRKLGISGDIPLLQSEDLFDVLTVTDIAVTFLSTTGLEAIGFGIPTITLNIVDEVDLRDYLTFVEDTIECRTPQGFYSILDEMVTEPARLQTQIERTRESRKRHFRNAEDFNTSEFVRDYIFAEVGLE